MITDRDRRRIIARGGGNISTAVWIIDYRWIMTRWLLALVLWMTVTTGASAYKQNIPLGEYLHTSFTISFVYLHIVRLPT